MQIIIELKQNENNNKNKEINKCYKLQETTNLNFMHVFRLPKCCRNNLDIKSVYHFLYFKTDLDCTQTLIRRLDTIRVH